MLINSTYMCYYNIDISEYLHFRKRDHLLLNEMITLYTSLHIELPY